MTISRGLSAPSGCEPLGAARSGWEPRPPCRSRRRSDCTRLALPAGELVRADVRAWAAAAAGDVGLRRVTAARRVDHERRRLRRATAGVEADRAARIRAGARHAFH